MNKATATYNASDVYEKWVDQLLKINPDYWTKASVRKKRRREFVYRKNRDQVIEVMTFTRWLKIVHIYFLMARQEVIKGRRVKLGHRMGAIRARRISRNFKNKQVNWAETMKQPYTINPETGRRKYERMIYYTSETYCRIAWERLGSIPNETIYKFVPSQGGKERGGFRRDFVMALNANPLLQTQYKQYIDELI